MNVDEIRSFLALELPTDVVRFLEDIINRLKRSGADVKWVNPNSIHLTLKFLGNINRSRIMEIRTSLNPILSVQPELELETTAVGAFPSLNQPRVIWVGVKEISGNAELVKIVSQVEEAFYQMGFDKETKSFTPHLTLGRARSSRNKGELAALINSTKSNVKLRFVVNRAVLFQSILERTGALYRELSTFEFKKTGFTD